MALGVLHPDRPALDPLNAIRRVAKLKNIARHALDGEILVHRADGLVLRLEQHLVVGGVGDRAAGGERGRPRAAPSAQNAIDRIAMDERAAAAPAGGEALAQHAHDRIEIPSRQGAERPRAAQPIIELRLRPILRGHFCNDLLREHIERPLWDRQAVKLSATDAVEKGRALDEIVARERKQAPLWRAADRMTGTADPLQEGRDRARRAHLTNEIDVADVDPEFERGGRHQGFQFAPLQPLFGREPELLRHAAVMCGDGLFAETIAELARDAFGHAPGVDEDERRAVFRDELSQPRIKFRPHLVRHHRLERRSWNLQAQIALTLMSRVDDRNLRGRLAVRRGAGEEMGDLFDWILRGGEADALQAVAA